MQDSRDAALLAARSYLTAADVAELVLPELREAEVVFALAARDLGYEAESTVGELIVTEISETEATVRAKQTLVWTNGDEETVHEHDDVLVHLADRQGWRVRDVVKEGVPTLSRLQRLTVEPAEAEGIRIRAWARHEPDGDLTLAIAVHNGTSRRWRLACAGATWRRGLLRGFAQVSSRALRRGGRVAYEPGTEHALMLRVPARAERIWLKATPGTGRRSLLFALSWDHAGFPTSPTESTRSVRKAVWAAAGILPLAAIAVFVGITRSIPFAIFVVAALAALTLLCPHFCALRLERKLARFRAARSG